MTTTESIDWKARLSKPETADQLSHLLDRAGDLERVLDLFTSAQQNVENLVATATDMVDEQSARAVQQGIDLEDRLGRVLQLLEQATRPEVLQAISKLLDRLPQLEKLTRMLDEVPGLLATLADLFDDLARKASEQGIDLEQSVTNGLHSMLWLGQQINQEELERLGVLLKSDMLKPNAIQVVANAANSLAFSQSTACDLSSPPRIGLFGLLGALRNENIQRALGFAVSFGKCFGKNLGQTPSET